MKKEERFQEALEKLLNMFQEGKMPEAVAFSIIRRKKGDRIPSMDWSVGNQILMMAYGTTDARGFKQWKDAGRHVKKGVKAIHILAPLTKKIKEEVHDEEKIIVIGFRTIPVFRIEDTEGEEVSTFDYEPEEYPPLYEVADRLGIKIQYAAISRNALGTYSSIGKQISLNAYDPVVYFHEISHAVDDLLHPKEFSDRSKKGLAESEIVAELSAAVFCQMQGIKGYEEQAYDYIKEYSEGGESSEKVIRSIMKVISRTEAIVTKIMDVAEEEEERMHA